METQQGDSQWIRIQASPIESNEQINILSLDVIDYFWNKRFIINNM